jgi:hypothetical protein
MAYASHWNATENTNNDLPGGAARKDTPMHSSSIRPALAIIAAACAHDRSGQVLRAHYFALPNPMCGSRQKVPAR